VRQSKITDFYEKGDEIRRFSSTYAKGVATSSATSTLHLHPKPSLQERITLILREGSFTASHIAKVLKMHRSHVSKTLKRMREQGFVRRIGSYAAPYELLVDVAEFKRGGMQGERLAIKFQVSNPVPISSNPIRVKAGFVKHVIRRNDATITLNIGSRHASLIITPAPVRGDSLDYIKHEMVENAIGLKHWLAQKFPQMQISEEYEIKKVLEKEQTPITAGTDASINKSKTGKGEIEFGENELKGLLTAGREIQEIKYHLNELAQLQADVSKGVVDNARILQQYGENIRSLTEQMGWVIEWIKRSGGGGLQVR